MRVSLLINALSAITASSAMPWDTNGGNKTRRHRIPVTSMQCMGDKLERAYWMGAKANMLAWASDHGMIRPGDYHSESVPNFNFSRGVTWYVCNCKYLWGNTVSHWELDEVQELLEEYCGESESGWIWSKRWLKAFNVMSTEWFKYKLADGKDICPPNCYAKW